MDRDSDNPGCFICGQNKLPNLDGLNDVPSNLKRFCVVATRYFGFRLNFDNESDRPEKTRHLSFNKQNHPFNEKKDFERQLCGDCEPCIRSFCDLYDQLVSIKLKLTQRTEQILDLMDRRGKRNDQNPRMSNDISKQFREKFRNFAKQKLEKAPPHLKLQRLDSDSPMKPGDDRDDDEHFLPVNVKVKTDEAVENPRSRRRPTKRRLAKTSFANDTDNNEDNFNGDVDDDDDLLNDSSDGFEDDNPKSEEVQIIKLEPDDNDQDVDTEDDDDDADAELKKKRSPPPLNEDAIQVPDVENISLQQNVPVPVTPGSSKHSAKKSKKSRRSSKEAKAKVAVDLDKLQCGFCGKLFRDRSYLRLHELTHTKTKPFKCNHCDQRFSQSSTRNKHEQVIHATGRPFKCGHCEKAFFTRADCRWHQKKRHKTEKCVVIEDKEILQEGQGSSSSSTQLFTCNLCQSRPVFKRQTDIEAHYIIYHKPSEGEPVKVKEKAEGQGHLKCRFCDRRFNYSQNRANHERLHTGEKPFKCSICDRAFTKRDNCKSHIKKVHKNEKIEGHIVKDSPIIRGIPDSDISKIVRQEGETTKQKNETGQNDGKMKTQVELVNVDDSQPGIDEDNAEEEISEDNDEGNRTGYKKLLIFC